MVINIPTHHFLIILLHFTIIYALEVKRLLRQCGKNIGQSAGVAASHLQAC